MLAHVLWAAAALVAALLLVPVTLRLVVDRPAATGQTVHARLAVGLLGGVVGLGLVCRGRDCRMYPLLAGRLVPFVSLRLGRGAPQVAPPTPSTAPAAGEPGAPAAAKPAPALGQRLERLAALLRWAWQPSLQLLGSLLHPLRLTRLQVSGRFGCEDPALTGRAYGWLQALRGLLPRCLQLEVQPDFVQRGFTGWVRARGRLHLGLLLLLVLRFLLRLAWRWLALRRAARSAARPVHAS